jgi:hypothetical protein
VGSAKVPEPDVVHSPGGGTPDEKVIDPVSEVIALFAQISTVAGPASTTGEGTIVRVITSEAPKQSPFRVDVKVMSTVPAAISAAEGSICSI